jgi:nucleoside-diphosphate-sugar epimerase
MVAQSISWAYAPAQGPADEDDPLDLDGRAGPPRYASVDALERTVRSLSRGTVLRYGVLYGPGTWFGAGGSTLSEASSGKVTATTAWTSFVHADDAADATVQALDWPAGTYNIVDDEPTHVDEWGPLLVQAVGSPVRAIRTLGEGRSASNRRARALGWVPAHPSWRTSLVDSI